MARGLRLFAAGLLLSVMALPGSARAQTIRPAPADPVPATQPAPAESPTDTSGYFHPWLNDPLVEAVAAGHAPHQVGLTSTGYTVGLCGAVQRYRQIVEAGGWPSVPDTGAVLKTGTSDPAVAVLRQRLAITGDLPPGADRTSQAFDDTLARAVRHFQARHGLKADGAVGAETLTALNISANIRLATLVINIERDREWAGDYGDRFLVVNIAASRLNLVEQGAVTFDTRVIVGRIDRTTPILHSRITRIDFNPYWYAPESITRRDLLAAIQNDPAYFFDNGIRVFSDDDGGREVPADQVDWYSYDGQQSLPFHMRQDPGPWNVLGPVRFVFANNHSVYLHGTSNEALFNQAVRTFSSGCVRVDGALAMATHLATEQEGWTPEKISEVIENYRTRSVKLRDPLPIHLIYRTAWVDADGTVEFRPDIYDWDAVLDINWGHVANVPCVYGVHETADVKLVGGRHGG